MAVVAGPGNASISSRIYETSETRDVLQTDKVDTSQSKTTDKPPLASARIYELTDVTLKFLASASNETLGVCAVGLCASTYLVLGRVGLVLIGAVGGVVLHATWEATNSQSLDSQSGLGNATRRRKELGVELAQRALDWRESSKNISVISGSARANVEASAATQELDYHGFRPKTASALTLLTDAIISNYVQ